jgi:hypothetical protein
MRKHVLVAIAVVSLVVATTTPGVSAGNLSRDALAQAGSSPTGIDQVLLYDQTASPGSYILNVQDFEAYYDAYDCEGADDFAVSWVDGWIINQVVLPGNYFSSSSGPMAAMNLWFYTTGGSTPGSIQCNYPSNSYTDDGMGNFIVDISAAPCFLPQGTYWVAAQARMDYDPFGQWGWQRQSVQTGAGAVWRNPGDGFGSGCTNWSPLAACGSVTGEPDFSFQLYGQNAQPGPTPTPPPAVAGEPIPAMSGYGIMIMIGLLVGVALLVMWRRS